MDDNVFAKASKISIALELLFSCIFVRTLRPQCQQLFNLLYMHFSISIFPHLNFPSFIYFSSTSSKVGSMSDWWLYWLVGYMVFCLTTSHLQMCGGQMLMDATFSSSSSFFQNQFIGILHANHNMNIKIYSKILMIDSFGTLR